MVSWATRAPTARWRFPRPRWSERPKQQPKTACVVGAGGIGQEAGRLCAALGMRVLGTRRTPQLGAPLPEGFSEIGSADGIDRFLPESDFVMICCQWAPEGLLCARRV